MTHIEGRIVQSFYDMALLSWHSAMSPLPLLATPPTPHYSFGQDHPVLAAKDINADKSRQTLAEHHADTEVWDDSNQAEADRVDGEFRDEAAVNTHLSEFMMDYR